MSALVHIDQLTLDEKLRFMEALWADLCRVEADLPVYQWQKDILDNREGLVDRGESEFEDWDIAKKNIAEEIS
jgi:hypothetical protein